MWKATYYTHIIKGIILSKLIINPMTTMFENKKIRTVSVDNKVYFIAKDVAETLAYKNPQEAIRNSCVDARSLDEIIDFVRGSENLTLLETLNIGLKGKKIKVIQQTRDEPIHRVFKNRTIYTTSTT